MIARVEQTRYLAAGNRFHRQPVFWASLSLDEPSPDTDRVSAIDATLHEFADQRRRHAETNSLSPAGLIADLSVALLRRAQEPVRFRRVWAEDERGRIPIVFACRSEQVARNALDLAIGLLAAASDDAIDQQVRDFARAAEPRVINTDDIFLVETAEERGIAWRLSVSGEREVVLGEGARSRRSLANLTDRTSFLGVSTCRSKWLTNVALRRAGLPATRQQRVHDPREAVAAAERIGYPVVVKPVGGSKGAGVACRLVDAGEVERAFAQATPHGGVIVENFLEGDDHRLLVIDGRFVRCTRRMRARVEGDGARSIEALVAAENARPERRPAPDCRFMPIRLDAETDRILGLQGLNRQSVPEAGAIAYLRATANWSLGGTAMLMTDKVHPDYVLLAEHAARLFGVDIVGVDVITDDISRSFRETGACINEVQTQPAIGAQRRALGPGVPKLHEALMDSLVTPAAGHHVPIVAVTGAHAEPVAGQIAAQLSARGAVVGMATRAGLDVEGRRLSADDHRGCRGLPRLVDDPMVAAIVVECQPAAVADDGLGHERVSLVVATGGDDRGDALAVLVALAEDGILSLSGDHAAAAAATIAAKTHRTVTASADALSSALGSLSAAAVEACMPALAPGQAR